MKNSWRSGGRTGAALAIVGMLIALAVYFRKPVGEVKVDPWFAAIILALAFHQPIVDRLKNLRSVSTPAGEFAFEVATRELADEAAEAARTQSQRTEFSHDSLPQLGEGWDEEELRASRIEYEDERCAQALHRAQAEFNIRDDFSVYYRLATSEPEVAVVRGAARVEQLASNAFHAVEARSQAAEANYLDRPRGWVRMAELPELAQYGLSQQVIGVANEVRRVRNRVVHSDSDELSAVAAVNFMNAADNSRSRSSVLSIRSPDSCPCGIH